MREAFGDLWRFHRDGEWVCVTTNGMRKANGEAVMGAGVAKAAAGEHPELPRLLGDYLARYGNRVFVFPRLRIITFPTKHNWRAPSDLALIEKSCLELIQVMDKFRLAPVYLPRPGCQNGGLEWEDVRNIIAPILDDRVVVIDWVAVEPKLETGRCICRGFYQPPGCPVHGGKP